MYHTVIKCKKMIFEKNVTRDSSILSPQYCQCISLAVWEIYLFFFFWQ